MDAKGLIALMGSGELTATMVEVHKGLLAGLQVVPRAVFLDTPAGFQLNVGQLAERAEDYFRKRVGTDMQTASLRSRDVPPPEAEEAFQILRRAGYILVGPGSPTYAVQQWREGDSCSRDPAGEDPLWRMPGGGQRSGAHRGPLHSSRV